MPEPAQPFPFSVEEKSVLQADRAHLISEAERYRGNISAVCIQDLYSHDQSPMTVER